MKKIILKMYIDNFVYRNIISIKNYINFLSLTIILILLPFLSSAQIEKVDSLMSYNFSLLESIYIDKELELNSKNMDDVYSFIEEISELSGIEPEKKVVNSSYFLTLIIDKRLIDKWKLWYEENKNYLKWNAENDSIYVSPIPYLDIEIK